MTPRAALQALVEELEPCIVAGCGPATRYRGPFPRVYYCDAHGHMCSELRTAEATRAALRVLAEQDLPPVDSSDEEIVDGLVAKKVASATTRVLAEPEEDGRAKLVRAIDEAMLSAGPASGHVRRGLKAAILHAWDREVQAGEGAYERTNARMLAQAIVDASDELHGCNEHRFVGTDPCPKCEDRRIRSSLAAALEPAPEPAAPCPGTQESLWTAKPDPMLLPSFESFVDPNVTFLPKACTCCGGHVAIAFRESNRGDEISCCSCECRWLSVEIRAGSCVLGDVVPCTGKAAGGGG